MAIKTGEFITNLSTQAGIPLEDANLKALQVALATVEMPDEIVNKITDYQKGLLTVEAAKAHPDIKKAFFAQFADGIEAEQETVLEKYGIDKEMYAEIKKSRLGSKRLEDTLKKVEELTIKKHATPSDDKEKHKKLSDEITALNQKVTNTITEYEQKLADEKKSKSDVLKNYKQNEFFNGYTYTDSIPVEVRQITAKSVYDNDVKKNGYKVGFNEETGEFSLQTSEDTPVFKNNKPVTHKEYVDGLFAEKNLLKVTAQKTNGQQKAAHLVISGDNKMDTSTFDAANKQALADYERGSSKTN